MDTHSFPVGGSYRELEANDEPEVPEATSSTAVASAPVASPALGPPRRSSRDRQVLTFDVQDDSPGEEEDLAPPTAVTFRDSINDLLDKPESSAAAQAIHYFMIFLILASTASVIIETLPECRNAPGFFPFEMFITALFTVEFALRLYACESIRAFLTNGFNLIDFLAIFPGYLELALPFILSSDDSSKAQGLHKAAGSMRTLRMVRMIRLVRVIRVMRLAKVARHSQVLNIILAVLYKVSQSGLVVVLMLFSFAMVLSASLIYLFESEHCEETGAFCDGPAAFVSIPSSFWWSISTLTTVGYGDMVPHTVAGKIIAGLTAVVGVIVVAIGIALVTINFRESYHEEGARVRQRRRGQTLTRSAKKKDSKEIERLLQEFDVASQALRHKLKGVVDKYVGDAHRPAGGTAVRGVPLTGAIRLPMREMLGMLTDHAEGFSKDVQIYAKLLQSDFGEQTGGVGSEAYGDADKVEENRRQRRPGLGLPRDEIFSGSEGDSVDVGDKPYGTTGWSNATGGSVGSQAVGSAGISDTVNSQYSMRELHTS